MCTPLKGLENISCGMQQRIDHRTICALCVWALSFTCIDRLAGNLLQNTTNKEGILRYHRRQHNAIMAALQKKQERRAALQKQYKERSTFVQSHLHNCRKTLSSLQAVSKALRQQLSLLNMETEKSDRCAALPFSQLYSPERQVYDQTPLLKMSQMVGQPTSVCLLMTLLFGSAS
jgi:septal ring factor EnvC (AmiA/AmiB activator)